MTLSPLFIHFKSCHWKNHPSFVNSGLNSLCWRGCLFFGRVSGWEAGFTLIRKQRLQSLVSHRLAAFFLGFNLISTERVLPGSPLRLQNKKSTEPKLGAGSGADVSARVIYVGVFSLLSDGESRTVACDSSFTSKQRGTHAGKRGSEGRAGSGYAFLGTSPQGLVFEKGTFTEELLPESSSTKTNYGSMCVLSLRG